ncbi:MAG: helix-turn-helix transcriptional regulator [Lachnospiraceae bacterium]|jgi:DNA-binding XRE family transcriptional regulator|nr:helix-turn-helix transcriptional regulator [Lachnospiraceae bacterium]
MDCVKKMKEWKAVTGKNRKELAKLLDIPYRTLTEWERGTRCAPLYVIRYIDYYIKNEHLDIYPYVPEIDDYL